ncbi:MAG: hypothetical protein HGA45_28455 [Chloroflexales bacterium]|nr:hypothetical protein [Chloroflexales bacterium]
MDEQSRLNELRLPSAVTAAQDLARKIARSADLAGQVALHSRPPAASGFGPRLLGRFDAAQAPGVWAASLAARYVAGEASAPTADLPLSPRALAQRHTAMPRPASTLWPGAGFTTAEPAREPLLDDLTALGWGEQPGRGP